jgi:mRNA-degrading endonuclease RelE of RelBE toxin-antitoxin system
MDCYNVVLTASARLEMRNLPGNIRPRILRVLEDMESNPVPPRTKNMTTDDLNRVLPDGLNFYRTRLDNWRIIYVVEEELTFITVLAIRKRPPYQYEDFQNLVDRLLES